MIKYNKQTFHNFLHPYWVVKMIEAGINVENEASYYFDNQYNVWHIDELKNTNGYMPTLTFADMSYMMDEWIYKKDGDKIFSGPGEMTLKYFKDAPFYIFGYYNDIKDSEFKFSNDKSYIEAYAETPIVGFARFLICGLNENLKYWKNINEKYDETSWNWENNHIDTKTWNIKKEES